MYLTQRSIGREGIASLDREIEALQDAVAQARQNRWHGGDVVVEPELEPVLAAVTGFGRSVANRPVHQDPAQLVAPMRRNSWREAVEADRVEHARRLLALEGAETTSGLDPVGAPEGEARGGGTVGLTPEGRFGVPPADHLG